MITFAWMILTIVLMPFGYKIFFLAKFIFTPSTLQKIHIGSVSLAHSFVNLPLPWYNYQIFCLGTPQNIPLVESGTVVSALLHIYLGAGFGTDSLCEYSC